MKSDSHIFIWDSDAAPPSVGGTLVLWRAFSHGTSTHCVSVPRLVEDNAVELRDRYLSLVYELGDHRINGRRLIDSLQLRPHFSFWWMSLLVEKGNICKSPQIHDAIRFLAFIDWFSGQSVVQLTLSSPSSALADCVLQWCKRMNIVFNWHQLPSPVAPLFFIGRLYSALPLTVQAFVWLSKYLWDHWPLRGIGISSWRQSLATTTFVTYTAHLFPESVRDGLYKSRYWDRLTDVLKEEHISSNWLHIFVKDELLSSPAEAALALESFNKSSFGYQNHASLDSFIGLRVIFRTLRDFVRVYLSSLRLGGVLFNPMRESSCDLWPLLRSDWLESIYGSTAMQSLLFLNLFEAAFESLPRQSHGVYLKENIGWESGFIHAWRKSGHGYLTGVPHATVRFWDLRYFHDRRSLQSTGSNDLPVPDLVACNGPMMRLTCLDGGYHPDHLSDVEALRYLHLLQPKSRVDPILSSERSLFSLLVLGDYLLSSTVLQMNLLEKALALIPLSLLIVVKPHPLCPIDPSDYPSLEIRLSSEPIAELLDQCHIAYASATTSAAVDAYCAGVPVVSVLDPSSFNLSPLRGRAGALFASTPQELASAISLAANDFSLADRRSDIFNLDFELSNWRKLLGDLRA